MLDTPTVLTTEHLTLRPWREDDAPAALEVYGRPAVARWLSPVMDRVPDVAAMRLLLQQWVAEDARMPPPRGQVGDRTQCRWTGDRRCWQLHPGMWGNGYASEATYALAGWALGQDVDEISAVVRPGNSRAAATVRRNGMQWVGETDKYFGLRLQVYRLRLADLDRTAPEADHAPSRRDG